MTQRDDLKLVQSRDLDRRLAPNWGQCGAALEIKGPSKPLRKLTELFEAHSSKDESWSGQRRGPPPSTGKTFRLMQTHDWLMAMMPTLFPQFENQPTNQSFEQDGDCFSFWRHFSLSFSLLHLFLPVSFLLFLLLDLLPSLHVFFFLLFSLFFLLLPPSLFFSVFSILPFFYLTFSSVCSFHFQPWFL